MAKGRKKKRVVGKIIFGSLLIILSGILFVGVNVCGLDAWHRFDSQRILGADESLLIYDSDMNEISTLYVTQNRISVPLSNIPLIVQKAFISTEDARFYEHKGVDLIRIAGAALEDIKQGGYVQGASTISQQLIKLSHLSTEKTMQRKAEEAVLAYIMENKYSKDKILEMYLNYVYFGGGFYGIEAASRGYFGKSASELSVAEGAVLAGILKSPAKYAPHLNYEASMGRHNVVLGLMHNYEYLSDAEYKDALDEKIVLDMKRNSQRSYFIDYAMNEACNILDISTKELMKGGYRVYTSINTDIQDICDDIYSDEDFFPNDDVQSAMAVVDTDTGYIQAMIGGRGEYVPQSFNRAVEIRRQPGSVIKPLIVYATAIEYYNYTAASVIDDSPKTFGKYAPKNSGNKYYGNVTLRKAITSSLNIPAVTVLNDIGVENGKRFAESVGIEFTDSDTNLSLALGGFTYGVSPLQIANAYGALCDGFYTDSSSVISITDKSGKVLYTNNVKKKRVMSDENAYILTNMLCSVAKEGTGHRLNELDFDVACKTGTVSSIDDKSNRDAWICAYTNDIAVSVWMGYDNSDDGKLKSSVTGGTYPAIVARELLKEYYKDNTPKFIKPDRVLKVRIDRRSIESDAVATLAPVLTPKEYCYYEYFTEGTQPKDVGDYWQIPYAPDNFRCINADKSRIDFIFTVNNSNTVYCLFRKYNGKEEEVDRITGCQGDVVTISDKKPPNVKEVEYFIRPEHIELEIDGEKVKGADSALITVVLKKNKSKK